MFLLNVQESKALWLQYKAKYFCIQLTNESNIYIVGSTACSQHGGCSLIWE